MIVFNNNRINIIIETKADMWNQLVDIEGYLEWQDEQLFPFKVVSFWSYENAT